ncbi:MAG TPA: hypothetical protein PKY82_01995 [Pyrinomonadaceae bacterium]|nr:hypothetical protein [Pyrinomonadaceae bacterium]
MNICSQFTERFPDLKGTYQERAEEAVAGCSNCDGIPPGKQEESTELSDLLEEVERLIWLDNCRIQINWETKPLFYYELFEQWRKAEAEVKNCREIRMQYFIKNFKLF